jgi:alkylated DNA repair dioxygenase AlkB
VVPSAPAAANLLPRDGIVRLVEGALPAGLADRALAALLREAAWREEEAVLFGRRLKVPRLVAWHGDAAYGYSGIRHEPLAWTPLLLELKALAEEQAVVGFNSVLLNLYRDGQDSMGWHSDDEQELGRDPVIASLSLGAGRRFHLKHQASGKRLTLDLGHGSWLIMAGSCQHHWRHALPKTRKPVAARVNLTFRRILADGAQGGSR